MYYDIVGLCPRTDISMGKHGFGIRLYPQWKEMVVLRNLSQGEIEVGLNNMGRIWLDSCGYGQMFDPDNHGFDKDKKKSLGPDARKSYSPNRDLRVTWGEWGPEHITVPGNACGLDIGRGIGSPHNGGILQPHNIDTTSQKLLLLVVFTWFANDLALAWESR